MKIIALVMSLVSMHWCIQLAAQTVPLGPVVNIDIPSINQIHGWAVSSVAIARVALTVDGVAVATVPVPRGDVCKAYAAPGCPYVGWEAPWLPTFNVAHVMTITATDANGRAASQSLAWGWGSIAGAPGAQGIQGIQGPPGAAGSPGGGTGGVYTINCPNEWLLETLTFAGGSAWNFAGVVNGSAVDVRVNGATLPTVCYGVSRVSTTGPDAIVFVVALGCPAVPSAGADVEAFHF